MPAEPVVAAADTAASAAAAFEWPITRLSYALSGNYRGEVVEARRSSGCAWPRYQVPDVWIGAGRAALGRRMSSDGESANRA